MTAVTMNSIGGSGAAREINGPEVRGGMQKFEGDEDVAVVVSDESSHAAKRVLVGLKVGNDELLESDDVGREGDEAACPADIRRGSGFGKGRVRRMAVDEHGHGGGDAVGAAFFGGGRASSIARFAAERAPAGKDELAQAHDLGRTREGGFAATRETFCWEEVVYTEIPMARLVRRLYITDR